MQRCGHQHIAVNKESAAEWVHEQGDSHDFARIKVD